MPRGPRPRSEAGLYHVSTRGTGRHSIFEDDEDRACLKRLLARGCDTHDVSVLVWCFMENHVHALLESPAEPPSDFMRDVFSHYAGEYNRCHDHVGHDFQGRFHGSPVDDERHLQAVVPYIHLNPAHGDFDRARSFAWSSYQEVLNGGGLADVEWVLGLYGSVEAFEDAHRVAFARQEAIVLAHAGRHLTDEEARVVYDQVLLGMGIDGELGAVEKGLRNRAIGALRAVCLSVRQIERFSGLGRGIIQRVPAEPSILV